MRTYLTTAVGVAFLLLSAIAHAQDATSSEDQSAVAQPSDVDEAKANIARMKTRPIYKDGPEPEFPDSERALGHHGVVTITGILGVDGRLRNARVQKSSGVPFLDQSALTAYEASTWTPATDAEGNPIPVPISAPHEFYSYKSKAPGGGVPSYACRQFVLDMDWWKATFPEAKWNDHELYKLMSGMALAQSVLTKSPITNFSADFEKRWNSAITACRSRPNGRFVDALLFR